MNKPLVSICCITYNHNNYIHDAIQSFLNQRADFPTEIIIHDDASKDGTSEIVLQYANEHPRVIISILQKENQYSIGINPFYEYILPITKGKYIAVCEGDDYWTDPLKLQKQVDFLEANPDYTLCFHDALILWENKQHPPKYFCANDQKDTSTILDIIDKWFIPSASMVIRRDAVLPLPDWFIEVYNGDWALQMLAASKGKVYYMDKVMSVYRKTQGALSGSVGSDTEFVNTKKILLLNYLNEHTNFKFAPQVIEKIRLLKKDIVRYKLRKKNKIFYWVRYPKAFFRSVTNKLMHCHD